MNEEVKMCPFCKSLNLLIPSEKNNLTWVICNSCEADGPIGKSYEEGIEKWNRR